ncbi:MAG: alpha/beta fold hydrolase [Vicinamibacterales bacterium]
MTGRLTMIVLLLVALAKPAWAQPPVDWKDPSPHKATFVALEDGVELEVLDWGGSGRSIVLLAGLGDTAHVFDDFAPMLARQYRVVGITRRGHGRSSAPGSGYEFARLAEDVARVIDAVGLKRPVIAGHSLAGEELHILGARDPAQIGGLVYIDAAFNRADGSEDYDAVARTLPPRPGPQPSDLASFAALAAFLKSTQSAIPPEAHLRARYVAQADGSVGDAWMPALPVRQGFMNEMKRSFQSYTPARIGVPALAIYAVPTSATDLMRPWYKADDSKNVERLYVLARERFRRHAQWFEAFAERGRVSEISGEHHLFLSHARAVLQQIQDFMSSLSERP